MHDTLARLARMKVTKMTDGAKKWRVDWRDDQGKRRRTRFATRREADEFMAKTAIAVHSGDWVDPALTRKTRVHEVYESWIERIEIKGARGKGPAAPKTVEGYRSMYRSQIQPRWGKISLDQVTYEGVEEWSKSIEASARTRHEATSIFLRILDEAVRKNFVAKNPAKDRNGKVDYLPRVENVKDHIYLSARQLSTLRDAMPSDMTRLLILLGGLSGLRWGEATALQWEDVDTERGLAYVQRANSDVNGKLILGDTKNHEQRYVPLHKPTIEAIEVVRNSSGARPGEPVVKSAMGKYLRNRNFTKRTLIPWLKSDANDSIPQELRFHDLRHTAVSLSISSGANIKVVQAIAGHASAQMTLDVYAGLFLDDLTDVTAKVDELIADAFEVART